MSKNQGAIFVDLDGTLAYYDGWRGVEHIGEPIEPMMNRVREWLIRGRIVKIFTARACDPRAIPYIQAWLDSHGIGHLEITNIKDYSMVECWDDRAIRVVLNSGEPCCKYVELKDN